MKVVVIGNPRSGRGRGAAAAEAAARWLRSGRGGSHEVVSFGTPESPETSDDRLAGAGAAVIVGGDGSVHYNAGLAARLGVPVYHLPYGNENLFAREFGMDRSLERLSRALEAGRTIQVDLGRIGNGPFLIMASFGPDASIVHRLDQSRTRATGHLAYTKPMLAELIRPHFPRLSVMADGRTIIDGQRGILIIANSRQYAFRLDPLHAASMHDGRLDVLFMPCTSRISFCLWAAACAMRRTHRRGATQVVASELVVIAHDGPAPYQVDGEAPKGGMLTGSIELRAEAGALPVLVPVEYQPPAGTTLPPRMTVSTTSAATS